MAAPGLVEQCWFVVAAAGTVPRVRLAPGQNPTSSVKGVLADTSERDVSCVAAGVPAIAAAVLVNLTATGQAGPGYLAARASGSAYGGTSSVNWNAADTSTANECIVRCGPNASIVIRSGSTSAHFIVDVVGYFL